MCCLLISFRLSYNVLKCVADLQLVDSLKVILFVENHSGSADDLFHKSISGLMVAIFRTTFKSTTTTITVEDNFNCEKLKN